jgi:arginase
MKNRIAVSPFFLDQPLPLLERFASQDWHLNKPQLDAGDRLARMASVHRPLSQFVAQAAHDGERPVSIAGDCCAPIAVLAGLQSAGVRPTLVWLDAHGDFNTPETSPSGFIGGMPLAMIVGRGDQTLPRAAGLTTHAEAAVFLADARDLDPEEAEAVRDSEVHHVPRLTDLPRQLPAGPLYVHLDVDVLSPDDAPSMSYPATGGPSLAEACAALEAVAGTGRVVAVSMTVWDLEHDTDRRTEEACMRLLRSLTGEV